MLWGEKKLGTAIRVTGPLAVVVVLLVIINPYVFGGYRSETSSIIPALHIVKVSNVIWWEDWWISQGLPERAATHGCGDRWHSDSIAWPNMTRIWLSDARVFWLKYPTCSVCGSYCNSLYTVHGLVIDFYCPYCRPRVWVNVSVLG